MQGGQVFTTLVVLWLIYTHSSINTLFYYYVFIYIAFLSRGSTIESDRYIHLYKHQRSWKPAYVAISGQISFTNAACVIPPCQCTSGKTMETIDSMGWTTLPRPSYSQDLAPSDYHMFGLMKLHVKDIYHENDDDLKTTVTKWLREQPPEFSWQGILGLTEEVG